MQFMSAFAMSSKSETQMLDSVNSFSEIIKTYPFVWGAGDEFAFASDLNVTIFFG